MIEPNTTRRRSRWQLQIALVAGVVGVAVTAGSAAAKQDQQPPANGQQVNGQQAQQAPANGPQTASPFWDGERAGARPHDPYHRGRDRDGDFSQHFPVDLAAQVAPARERFVALKQSHQAAQNQLRTRLNLLRRQLEESEEYRNLQRERAQAQAELDRVQQEALEPLLEDPEYDAVVELQGDIERQIRQEHQRQNPSMDRLRALAELHLSYTQRRRDMEASVTASNGRLDEARERLRDLTREQNELEQEHNRQVRDDEELAMLREQISQLQVAYRAAGAYYESAVRAADIATDFAYYNAFTRGGAASPYLGNPYLGGHLPYYPYGYHPPIWHGGLIIAAPTGPAVRVTPTPGRMGNVIIGGPRHTMTPGTGASPVHRPPHTGTGDRVRTRDNQ